MNPHLRLLFICLPMYADCEGRLEDDPERIHIEIFPYEPKLNIKKMLDDLSNGKFITRYENDEGKFIWINKFLEHQNPHKHEKERGSDIKPFDEINHKPTLLRERPENRQSSPADSLNLSPDSLNLSPRDPVEDCIDEITSFYKENINPVEIPSGKRNLRNLIKKLGKKSTNELFQYVKNYHDTIKTGDGKFVIRMRNFFGRDARYEDYMEPLTKTRIRHLDVKDMPTIVNSRGETAKQQEARWKKEYKQQNDG